MLPMPQSRRRGQTKMASRMDNKQQGCCKKTIFSIRTEQTRDKIITNREASSRADRTWENKDISLYLFNLRDDARCICGHNDQTMDHLLFHCEKNSTQREVLKHQINQQRNWMEIKQELVSKHKKVFCEFIESIDFELLLQNEQ